ncbi:MAG: hypothetical protein R3A44_25915 [Caldilineaceae bacterium]
MSILDDFNVGILAGLIANTIFSIIGYIWKKSKYSKLYLILGLFLLIMFIVYEYYSKSPKAEILSLENNSLVYRNTTIIGIATRIPKEYHLWVYVKPQGSKYRLKSPEKTAERNGWKADVLIGEEEIDERERFEIGAFIMDDEDHNLIWDIYTNNTNHLGYENLPKSTKILVKIDVFREP